MSYPQESTLDQMFRSQVYETPDAFAVTAGLSKLTYGELDRRANRLARYLRELGVGPEVLVGLCLKRSLELVVGVLAVHKAGGAYVPLDPEYPAERLSFMLEDAEAPILLTQDGLVGSLTRQSTERVHLDGDWTRISRESDEPLQTVVTSHNLSHVIYTSGSTGQPKGVAIEHRSVVALLHWARKVFTPEEMAGVLASTSICFDLSVFELFAPLTSGGRIILADNALELPELPAASEVTLVNTVPSAMGELVRRRGVPPSVRTVNLAGEPLKTALVRGIYESTSATRVYDLYGPSEDTTYSTYALRDPDARPTIGRPITNTRVYLLDENRQPVPIGEPGEIYLGGDGLARGYLKRPHLTAEKFISNPFSAALEDRLYRTGDIARYSTVGNLEFLGRRDHQVKIRGFRVELGEIEAVLETHSDVKEAVAIVRGEELADKRLVAYVVCHADRRVTTSSLRTFLQETLPDHMIPSAFLLLDAMPLTPSGKIDRLNLPEPGRERPELDQPFSPPRNALDEFIVKSWRELLNTDSVGIHDSFLELGGTSIQASRFTNRMQREIGQSIFVMALFDNPTVALYSEFLTANYGAQVASRFALPTCDERANTVSRIDADAIARMRDCVPTAPLRRPESAKPKNRSAIFILAPPRSGTTLLRVMLAGHPDLVTGSELQLLGFETMKQREAAFRGRHRVWLDGVIRLVMELHQCDADEARGIIAEYERADCTTKQFYGVLQEWIGDRKTLVDKTPAYAMDPACLERAERDFDEPLYVHLVRHPYATVRSFVDYHLDQALYLKENSFSPLELGELVWIVSHDTIRRFLSSIPSGRQYVVRFERLVQDPRYSMENLCSQLELSFHSDLIDPYKNIEQKMTDGIYADSAPMGDTKLLERRRIDPTAAESSRPVDPAHLLSDVTWELAKRLGYEGPRETSS